jgi:hypothetical protein
MNIEFDPFTIYPTAELETLTVSLPKEVLQQIDDALEGMPFVKTRDRFMGFAVLFALADIQHDAAATLDRS